MRRLIESIVILALAQAMVSCSFDCSKAWKSLPINPDTNIALMEEQIAANPDQWKAAYEFLTDNDLASLPLGRHEIVEGGAYANVQEYDTRVEGKFEAHKDYIDVQIVVSGEEEVHVADIADAVDCLKEYDKTKDVMFYSSASEFKVYKACSSCWIVLFPGELHRPGLAKNGTPSPVKKVVVKIPVAE